MFVRHRTEELIESQGVTNDSKFIGLIMKISKSSIYFFLNMHEEFP